MALTTTTLSSAVVVNDNTIAVTSATGFAAGYTVQIDGELMQIQSSYVSGTAIPVLRGKHGTSTVAHASGANVTAGVGSDWANPSAAVVPPYPLAGRRRKVQSYSASGAIELPTSGEDIIAILNGTSVLVMTIAAPGKDNDGAMLVVMGNGAAAHTIQFTGGLSGAGGSYDIITVNATAPIAVMAFACNGLWITPAGPALTGTVTNITGGVA